MRFVQDELQGAAARRHQNLAVATGLRDACDAVVVGEIDMVPILLGEARVALEQEQARETLARVRVAARVFLVLGLLAGAVLLPNARSYLGLAAVVAPLLLASVACAYFARCSVRRVPWDVATIFGLITIAMIAASGLYGARVLVPTLAAATTALWDEPRTQRYRAPLLLAGCATVGAPAALEWAGILPKSYVFTGGDMVILPVLRDFSEVSVRLGLLGASLIAIVAPALTLWWMGRALDRARRDMHTDLWHLSQLVPSTARALPPEENDAAR